VPVVDVGVVLHAVPPALASVWAVAALVRVVRFLLQVPVRIGIPRTIGLVKGLAQPKSDVPVSTGVRPRCKGTILRAPSPGTCTRRPPLASSTWVLPVVSKVPWRGRSVERHGVNEVPDAKRVWPSTSLSAREVGGVYYVQFGSRPTAFRIVEASHMTLHSLLHSLYGNWLRGLDETEIPPNIP
jgi:hypothetical protein